MTTKELLYVEDALGHAQYLRTKCAEAVAQLQDPQLRACAKELEQKQQELFQSFYGLL